MEAEQKIIIITGANKGVGFGITEGLCQKNYKIIMACRNTKLGQESADSLNQKYSLPEGKLVVMECDIVNPESIKNFFAAFKGQFGQCDILLNNAGFAYKGSIFNEDVVSETFAVNYFGTKNMCETFLPIVKSRIINCTSMAGRYNKITDPGLL